MPSLFGNSSNFWGLLNFAYCFCIPILDRSKQRYDSYSSTFWRSNEWILPNKIRETLPELEGDWREMIGAETVFCDEVVFENMNDKPWMDTRLCLLHHSVNDKFPHLQYVIEWNQCVFIWKDLWTVVMSMTILTSKYCIEDQALLVTLISVTDCSRDVCLPWRQRSWF